MNKDNNKKTAHVMNRFYKSAMILFYLLILSSLLTACGSGGGDVSGDVSGVTSDQTKTVSLSWYPSPSEDIAGYKIYYNSGEATFPVGVLGANEGTSPLDVGNITTSKITGLFNNELYYFTVTAYDSNGYESSYSNIVTSLPEGQ